MDTEKKAMPAAERLALRELLERGLVGQIDEQRFELLPEIPRGQPLDALVDSRAAMLLEIVQLRRALAGHEPGWGAWWIGEAV